MGARMGNRFPCLQKDHRQGAFRKGSDSAHRLTFWLLTAYTALPSSAGEAKALQMMKPISKMRNHPWGCTQGLAGKPSLSNPRVAIRS